jgi:benzoate transport
MSAFQRGIIAICVAIAGLDGFDVLVVAFTATALAGEWALSPSALGVVLSSGLAGMGLGALAMGPVGDRLGRRPAVLISLVGLAVGMGLSALATSAALFAASRFFTGLWIGGILANINIVVIEYSSDRRRKLNIALMTVGYPIGATIGGLAAVYLLSAYGWRSVYWFGAAAGLVLLPLAAIWIPESLDFLLARRPAGALERINRILARLGQPALDALPGGGTPRSADVRLTAVFGAGHRTQTIAASAAYFCVMMTVYFLLSWTPRTLTELGFSATAGINGSLLMNIGGAVGCILYGLAAERFGARRMATFVTVGLFVTSMMFGFVPPVQGTLMLAALAVGFCLNASISVLYAVVPETFPAAIRTTGTGWAMSIGRLGAVAGPSLAGVLIEAGWSRPAYFTALGVPMLLAAFCLRWIRPSAAAAAPLST